MNRMRSRSLLPLVALSLWTSTTATAQGLAAFTDYMDRFHVFDKGTFTQLENLPPRSVQMGDRSVFYSSNNSDLKMYANGKTVTLDRSAAEFKATDHLMAYKLATSLKLYDHGEVIPLCYNTGNWAVDDSIVGWYDEAQRTINVRYEGENIQLEDALANNPLHSWKTGDNLVAWVTNIENKLKVFYHGDIYELTPQANEVPYEAALDMVVYQDSQDNGFHAFLRGEIIDLEPIMPKSFKMGKGVMAYVDMSGSLKVLSGTKVYTAYTYEPQEYYVVDSLVIIKDRDRLKAFANGQLQELENYWPEQWKASWGTLAYVDVNRAVKVWRQGKSEVAIQRKTFQDFTFDRGTLLLNMPNKKVKVWWNGQVYAH